MVLKTINQSTAKRSIFYF